MTVAFAALLATTAQAREPNVKGFKAYSLPGYTIVTHDEVSARRLPPQIEMIERVLDRLMPGGARAGGIPTYFLVVPPHFFLDYLHEQPCPYYVCGKFVAGRFVNYILIADTREPYSLRRAVFHQYTHFALHTRVRGIRPLWFDEGMAMLSESVAFNVSTAIVGATPSPFQGWLPMEQLLHLDGNSPDRRYFSGCSASSSPMQTSSWALIHRGMVAEPEFGKQIFSFLEAINDLKPVDEGLRDSLGVSSSELNRVMYHYVQSHPLKKIRFEVGKTPAETRIPGRKMNELESLELLADVMFTSGVMPERVPEVVAAARRVAPDSPAVHVLRMRRAALIGHDEALEILMGEIGTRVSDPKVARGVALALFERLNDQRAAASVSGKRRLVFQDRAQHLLDQSLRAAPDDPEAAWAFGMLAASTQQFQGLAVQRLLSASEIAPASAEISMALALIHESMGKQEKMIAHLKDMERFSRSAVQRTWARERLNRAMR
jgi:hypothetical protein